MAAALLLATAVPVVAVADPPVAEAVSCTVTVRLSPGATGTPVRCLEQRLVELGYSIGTPNTVYDQTSVNAVRNFQSRRGLYPDGIVTSITGRQLGLRGALPPAGSPKLTVLGDSTSAAMRWYDEARNETTIYDIMGTTYDLQWSVESCRRLLSPSCVGRVDPGTGLRWRPVSVVPEMQGQLKGRLGNAVVVMAGYDDYPSLKDEIDALMIEAERQGVTRVFWLTYRTSTSYGYGVYYASHNRDLMAARTRHPNLVVLDWNGYTRTQSAATQDAWFEGDDIHMTRAGAIALARYLRTNIDKADVRACLPSSARTGTVGGAAGTPAAPAPTADGFTPMTAQRVFDSRYASLGGVAGRVGTGRFVTIDLSSRLPADATSAVVHVTAIRPCAVGFATVYACGTRPSTSSLNFESGRTTTALAISSLTAGTLCVYTSAATDLQVDLIGAFTPDGALFHELVPRRWVDTRGNAAVVPIRGSLSGGSAVTVPIAGRGGVPASATAAWLNIAAVSTSGTGTLTVHAGACGASNPAPPLTTTSVFRGRAAATASLVGLTGGAVCVRAVGGPVHVVIDVSGWFGGPAAGGLAYRPIAPIRLYDSRSGARRPAGAETALAAGPHVVINIAAVLSTGPGYISAKPCGATAVSAVLNTAWTETVSNVAAVSAGGNGRVCIGNSTPTHIVVDVLGRFVAPG